MADAAAPTAGKPKEHPRKGGFLTLVILLVALLGVIGGAFLRPTIDSYLGTDKDTQASGKALLEEVNTAIRNSEERQLQEAVRLYSTGSPKVLSNVGKVDATDVAEFRRISDILKGLYVLRESLKVAEHGGFRKERLDALTPVARERLDSIKTPLPTK